MLATSGSYGLPNSSSTKMAKPWGDGCQMNVLFRTLLSLTLYSLHLDQLGGLCVNYHLGQGEESLIWAYGVAIVLRNHFNTAGTGPVA